MNAKTLTAVALILVSLPTLGLAQGAGAPARPTMPQVDFATADADGNGAISAEEWAAYAQTLHQTMRSQGIAARADALIAAADSNGDGLLNRDEVIAGMTALGDQRRERMAGMRGERGEGRGWHDRRGDYRGEGRGWDHHGGRDGHGARGDGRRGEMRGQTRAEYRMMEPGARAARIFDRLDLNSDGGIDAEELALAQQVMARRMQRRAAD